MHVRITGNLSEGFEAIGPYADFDAAAEACDGWVMKMQPPSDLPLPEGLYLARNMSNGNYEILDAYHAVWMTITAGGRGQYRPEWQQAILQRVCAVFGIDWLQLHAAIAKNTKQEGR